MIKIGDLVVLKKGSFDKLYRDPKYDNKNIIEYIGCTERDIFLVYDKYRNDGIKYIVIEPIIHVGDWQKIETKESRFTTISKKRENTINKILKDEQGKINKNS